MADFLKKLNLLIKTTLPEGLPDADSHRASPDRLRKGIAREVDALRARVNDAIVYEDNLRKTLLQLDDEIVRWDRQADDAVQSGNDANARYALESQRRAEQRRTMLESDLREHRRATQDLLERVNLLDAMVSEAKRAADESVETSVSNEDNAQIRRISDVLRHARETITGLSEIIAGSTSGKLTDARVDPPIRLAQPVPSDSNPNMRDDENTSQEKDAAIEDDLERRIARLRKPG